MGAPKGNKYALGNNGGRPPLYKSAAELQNKIKEYFNGGCRTRKIITADGGTVEIPCPTISGLVLFLGFCNRHSFYDLENHKEFSDTVKKARTLIETEYEQMLHSGQCTGAIFALKNFGWKDKTEVENTGNITININPAT